MDSRIEEISLAEVLPDQTYRYRESDFDVSDLIESIDRDGLLVPIIVVEERGKYRLISGFRRFRALTELRISACKAKVFEKLSESEAHRVSIAENLVRKSLSAWEMITAARRMRDSGMKNRDVAVAFNATVRTIQRYLALSSAPEDYQEALKRNELTHSQARAGIDAGVSAAEARGNGVRGRSVRHLQEIAQRKRNVPKNRAVVKQRKDGLLDIHLRLSSDDMQARSIEREINNALSKVAVTEKLSAVLSGEGANLFRFSGSAPERLSFSPQRDSMLLSEGEFFHYSFANLALVREGDMVVGEGEQVIKVSSGKVIASGSLRLEGTVESDWAYLTYTFQADRQEFDQEGAWLIHYRYQASPLCLWLVKGGGDTIRFGHAALELSRDAGSESLIGTASGVGRDILSFSPDSPHSVVMLASVLQEAEFGVPDLSYELAESEVVRTGDRIDIDMSIAARRPGRDDVFTSGRQLFSGRMINDWLVGQYQFSDDVQKMDWYGMSLVQARYSQMGRSGLWLTRHWEEGNYVVGTSRLTL